MCEKQCYTQMKKIKRRHPEAYEDGNAEEIIDPDEVPDIAQFVETTDSLKCVFDHLMKTRVADDEHIHNTPGISFPVWGLFHQANVCDYCDCFIFGTNEVRWISKQNLLVNHERLVDNELSEGLKACCKVFDPDLQHLLLSPRARVVVYLYCLFILVLFPNVNAYG